MHTANDFVVPGYTDYCYMCNKSIRPNPLRSLCHKHYEELEPIDPKKIEEALEEGRKIYRLVVFGYEL